MLPFRIHPKVCWSDKDVFYKDFSLLLISTPCRPDRNNTRERGPVEVVAAGPILAVLNTTLSSDMLVPRCKSL